MASPTLRSRSRPFIGREREMQVLQGALDDAIAGHGRLVLLIGDPGMGKSRTAEEISSVAADRGADVLIGRCYEDGGAPALWPWTQILRSHVRGRDTAYLEGVMGAEGRELARVAAEMRTSNEGGSALATRGPESTRFRLFDWITSVLGRAARTRPLLLILDDLQGADRPSLLLLRFVSQNLRQIPLLILGTFREVALRQEDLLAETLAELVREQVTTRIFLRGFSEAEVAGFIEVTSGTTPPPALVTRVHERTDGNPFFVGEIVHWLVENGELAHPSGAIDVAIPEGVRAVVRRHLGRLSEECAAMLRLASGFGRQFRADAVAGATGLTPERLAELLSEALGERLIGDVPDQPGRYAFAHAITRDTLYDEVPAPHRAEVHLRLAEALEAATAEQNAPPVAELAAHFQIANDPRGIECGRRAGDRALELLAYEEAIRQYDLALATLDRVAPRDDETRCDVLIALAQAQNLAGETAAAKKTALQAAESARRREAHEQLRRAMALGLDGVHRKVDAVHAKADDAARAILTDDARGTAPSISWRDAGDGDRGVNVFRREGEYWTILYAGAAVRLRDTKGLHQIAHLLAHPRREIHVADLATLVFGPADEPVATGADLAPEGDLGAVLDPRAIAEYRARLADLREELDEATAAADTGRAERARGEIEEIAGALSRAHGLGGRVRKAGAPGERVRKAVTNQIRRTLDRVRAEHPALGRHLENSLRTGFVCSYTPEREIEWDL